MTANKKPVIVDIVISEEKLNELDKRLQNINFG